MNRRVSDPRERWQDICGLRMMLLLRVTSKKSIRERRRIRTEMRWKKECYESLPVRQCKAVFGTRKEKKREETHGVKRTSHLFVESKQSKEGRIQTQAQKLQTISTPVNRSDSVGEISLFSP